MAALTGLMIRFLYLQILGSPSYMRMRPEDPGYRERNRVLLLVGFLKMLAMSDPHIYFKTVHRHSHDNR
jgi:hypothetical protein